MKAEETSEKRNKLGEYRSSVAALRIAARAIESDMPVDSRESKCLLIAAGRFEEALRDRRRLLRQIRKLDPKNPVLLDIDGTE